MSFVAKIAELNPDALFLEPREHFDAAIVGITDSPDDHWPRESGVHVLVYDSEKTIDAIHAWLSETPAQYDSEEGAWSAAAEWFSFNTQGAWLGPGTPTFTWEEEDGEECEGRSVAMGCDLAVDGRAECPVPGACPIGHLRSAVQALLLLVVLGGCGPLSYVRSAPIEVPNPIEAPPLTVPSLRDDACPAFTIEDGEWVATDWSQPELELDLVLPGDGHPATEAGVATCSHLVVAAGWYVTAREARDRHPALVRQLELWRSYAERQAVRHQAEGEALEELVKLARRRQLEAALVGAGGGAAATAAVVLAILLTRE